MKFANDAYVAGAQAALGSFGIRIAGDLMGQRMPDGPQHLGAEWLSRTLSKATNEYSPHVGARSSHRKLEKPPMWGAPSSLESSGANGGSGMNQYGGV